MPATEKVRRARKAHRCDDYRSGCTGWIRPGDRYREHVIFPGHDVVVVKAPTRMRQCAACGTRSGHPLDEAVSA
jgi:hypothetical protein